LEAADVALSAAAKVTFKTSAEVDEKFERALEALDHYERNYFLPRGSVSNDRSARFVYGLMTAAKDKDKPSSLFINSLKEKLQVRDEVSPFPERILTQTPAPAN
jgi:hypothetical protein